MKKLILMAAILVATGFGFTANAQLNVSINIGSQPQWGPVGYNHVDYYYLPEIESYYSVQNRQYIYLDGNRWIFSRSLPARYSNYNLYNGYKVVVNQPRPYLNFKNDRVKYASFRTMHGKQVVIRDGRNKKYYKVKGHPYGAHSRLAKKGHIKRSHGQPHRSHGRH